MTFPIKAVFMLTGKLLRQGAVPLTLVTVLLYYLPRKALHPDFMWMMHTELGRLILSHTVIAGYVLLVLNQFISAFHLAAISEIALRTAAGKPLRWNRLLLNALVNAVPVFAMQFALQIATVLGVLLLVVPGVFVGVALSVVVPTYVCEGKGIIESFGRAFRLTEGRRWGIFAIWLVVRLMSFAVFPNSFLPQVSGLFGVIHWLAPAFPLPELPPGTDYGPTAAIAFDFLLTLITAILIVLNTAIYLTLRFHKAKKSGDDHVAEIFE